VRWCIRIPAWSQTHYSSTYDLAECKKILWDAYLDGATYHELIPVNVVYVGKDRHNIILLCHHGKNFL
jgi:hypothetical protein